jgi:hypothetical protein
MMQNTVKSCAEEFGFDPTLFGSHSLRIGGATHLAAAQAPHEWIMMLGRWKSAPVCLSYIHASSSSYDCMLQLLLAPGFFSEQDIRLGLSLPPRPAQAATRESNGMFGAQAHMTHPGSV